MRGSTVQDARDHRLLVSLLAPVAFFLVCLVVVRPQRAPPVLPEFRGIDPAAPCASIDVRVPVRCGPVGTVPGNDTVRHAECDPGSGWSRDWRLDLHIDIRDAPPDCRYEVVVLDTFRSSANLDQIRSLVRRHETYPLVETDVSTGFIRATIDARPSRTYGVIVIWQQGTRAGLARAPTLLGVRGGVRWIAVAQLLLAAGVASIASVLLVRFRPRRDLHIGGRRVGRFLPVALLGAGGGIAGGAVVRLLPPDFGGFDLPAWPTIGGPVLWAMSGALAACLFDFVRGGERGRSLLAILAWTPVLFVLTGTLLSLLYAIESRTGTVPSHFQVVGFKHVFFLYLGFSVTLPILLVDPAGLRRRETVEAMAPTRDGAVGLLGGSLLGGVVAMVVAIVAGSVLALPHAGQLSRGFYKPASAVGFLVAAVPVLFAMCLAVNLGRERPRWLVRVEEICAELLRGTDEARRAPIAREALALLLGQVPLPARVRPLLGCVAVTYSRNLRGFVREQNDLAQLAREMGLGCGDLSSKLDILARELAEIERALPTARSPLLLVEDGLALHTGVISLSAAEDIGLPPGERRVRCTRNGQPVCAGTGLADDVSHLVQQVLDKSVGSDPEGRFALARHVLSVGFEFGTTGREDLRGKSYQLPLALCTWQVARRANPRFERWAATGSVTLDSLEIGSAGDLAVKVGWLAQNAPAVLLCPVGASETLARRGGVFELRSRRDLAPVTRGAREALQSGSSPIVAAATLDLAAAFLFGAR